MIKEMIEFFMTKDDVQIAGFTQPVIYENGERSYYKLDLITNQKTIVSYELAKRVGFIDGRNCPYVFKQETFDIVLKTATEAVSNGNPALIFLDEIGSMESKEKGHYQAMLQYIKSYKNSKKLCIVPTYIDIRKVEVEKLLQTLNITIPNITISVPTEKDTELQFFQKVYEFMKT
ncbi:hypothetical protein GPJ56_001639 [Histomonas meleagridis]|uniref:uncharacterized protein n=1 Tax=Histomonas meleagridis TaxID=135588 RepID=UPI003559F7B4|nr:hypothetical protein GPJ56_001639 [Histomonas meleagridis]KAH0796275.1 hypothetical protein GO595_010168 [Histomonas meleagridis]